MSLGEHETEERFGVVATCEINSIYNALALDLSFKYDTGGQAIETRQEEKKATETTQSQLEG